MAENLPPAVVAELASQCVEHLGLDLDDVEVRGSGPNRVLRIVVDCDGGVPLDVISNASRELSRELDRSDAMGSSRYTLEVTSRGVDRPLTLPRHWMRNIGRLVVATTSDGARVRGRIASASSDAAHLEDGTPLAYADITRALIEPELTKQKSTSGRKS